MSNETQYIFCCECSSDVIAQLTDGAEVYPGRPDLHEIPFWICIRCKNYVGCHHEASTPTKPLGCIPNAEMRNARKHIHEILDPIWKSGKMNRNMAYQLVSGEMGIDDFHVGGIRTLEEAREVYRVVRMISNTLKG